MCKKVVDYTNINFSIFKIPALSHAYQNRILVKQEEKKHLKHFFFIFFAHCND